MKLLNNITETVFEDMQKTIGKKSKISMFASCFSMYAYNALRKQLNFSDEFRFIFTAPTFIEEKKINLGANFIFQNSTAKKVCMAQNLK